MNRIKWIINTSGLTTIEDWLDKDFVDVVESLVIIDNIDLL